MTASTHIEEFAQELRTLMPQVDVAMDAGRVDGGLIWVDMRLGKQMLSISWDLANGFGFYDETDPGFGHERTIETIKDPVQAARHFSTVAAQFGWSMGGDLTDTGRISYERVAQVDLDEIAHLTDEQLPAYFEGIAKQALSSQLHQFLDGMIAAGDDDEIERQRLIERYVERRVAVAIDLRRAKAAVDADINALFETIENASSAQ